MEPEVRIRPFEPALLRMQGSVANWQQTSPLQSISPQKNWVWNDTFGGQIYSLDAMGNFAKFYNNGVVD